MPKKLDKPQDNLIPGIGRLSLTLYDGEIQTYRGAGMQVAGLKIKNKRELKRLWARLERATRSGWRDDEQSDVPRAGVSTIGRV